MKKWLKTIIPVFAFAFILLIPGVQAQAGTISSVSATAGTNEFTVSGVAGDDVLSVAIFVYDSTGKTLLQMKSVAVDSNHTYTDTFEAEKGTYLVKVADYEGGAFSEANVTVGSTVTTTTTTTATTTTAATTAAAAATATTTNVAADETKTGDTAPIAALMLVAMVSFGTAVVVYRKKVNA